MPSDTLEIQPSVAATSVSFASPSRLVTTSYAESGQGALSPTGTVFSTDATSPSGHGLHAGASHITRHGVHKYS